MTNAEPKRARDVKVGDTLPDGSVVYHVAPNSSHGYNIRSRRADGSMRIMRYASETVIPNPGDRHPSRFVGGHPWDRKSRPYQR